MVKLYFDTEFTSFDRRSAELLSIAVLDDNDRLFYAEFELTGLQLKAASEWVKLNILGHKIGGEKKNKLWPSGKPPWSEDKTMFVEGGPDEVRTALVNWLKAYQGEEIVFVADVAAYDWVYTISWLAESYGGNIFPWADREGLNIRMQPEDLSHLLPSHYSRLGKLQEIVVPEVDSLLSKAVDAELKHTAWADAVVVRELYNRLKPDSDDKGPYFLASVWSKKEDLLEFTIWRPDKRFFFHYNDAVISRESYDLINDFMRGSLRGNHIALKPFAAQSLLAIVEDGGISMNSTIYTDDEMDYGVFLPYALNGLRYEESSSLRKVINAFLQIFKTNGEGSVTQGDSINRYFESDEYNSWKSLAIKLAGNVKYLGDWLDPSIERLTFIRGRTTLIGDKLPGSKVYPVDSKSKEGFSIVDFERIVNDRSFPETFKKAILTAEAYAAMAADKYSISRINL